MHAFLSLLVVILMLAVLAVLVAGIIGLFRGVDPRRSNKLMQYRVLLQGAALLLIFLIAMIFRQ